MNSCSGERKTSGKRQREDWFDKKKVSWFRGRGNKIFVLEK